MTSEDHKRLRYQGQARIASQLSELMRAGAMPTEGAESYVGGMVEGIREFMTAYVSEQAAYSLLQTAADRIVAQAAAPQAETR